jgi:rod shape-determining protein MreD
MNWLNTVLILLATVLAVFWEAAFHGIRHVIGAQVDLLPALIVYAALYGNIGVVGMVAVIGGLSFDSLSANPLGITVLPLFLCGWFINSIRDLILRDQTFAQFVIGYCASFATPVITLLLLLTTGKQPLFGWGTAWQLLVMSIGGAIATPIIFEAFALMDRIFGYRHSSELSFRPDREIRRGRN